MAWSCGAIYRCLLLSESEPPDGVRHPIQEIAEVVKGFENTAIVVDAITGIGVFDIPMDAWGLDVVVSGSQKALMLPPGLSFAALSDKAWKPHQIELTPDEIEARIAAIALYQSQLFAVFGDAATMPDRVRDYVRAAGGERYWERT